MKYKLGFLISIISISIAVFSGCTTNNPPEDENTLTVDVHGGADYTSIQAAIDAVLLNQTITVSKGIYYENLMVNKTVVLFGADPETTIIDANGSGDVITILGEGRLLISGFTLRNCGDSYSYPDYDAAIDINSNNNRIDNVIIAYNSIGIYSTHVRSNNFTNNLIHSNSDYGMYLYSDSDNNLLKNNVFRNNSCALRIKGSEDNTVVENLFKENQRGMYFCCGARSNIVYHNSFFNNTLWSGNDYVGGNDWDNGENSGNYWDDYAGVDEDADGIGDTPYNITTDGVKQDRYPLMEPFTSD